jgi:hypothetical protein
MQGGFIVVPATSRTPKSRDELRSDEMGVEGARVVSSKICSNVLGPSRGRLRLRDIDSKRASGRGRTGRTAAAEAAEMYHCETEGGRRAAERGWSKQHVRLVMSSGRAALR